jgi:hypothetical protein
LNQISSPHAHLHRNAGLQVWSNRLKSTANIQGHEENPGYNMYYPYKPEHNPAQHGTTLSSENQAATDEV